jgi:hypothetical protein
LEKTRNSLVDQAINMAAELEGAEASMRKEIEVRISRVAHRFALYYFKSV